MDFTSLSRRAAIGTALSGTCLALAPQAQARAAGSKPYDWRSVPYGGTGYVDGFLYHPRQKDLLYARTDIGGMYRYDYAARRWMPLLDHLGHDDSHLMGVLSMAIDPGDPDKLYAACGLYLQDWAAPGAILRSSDRGATWRKAALPIKVGGNADGRGTGDRLMVDPTQPSVLFYGSNQDGLWKSVNGGESFARAPASPGTSLTLVLFAPGGGEMIVGSADGKGGLFASTDRGVSFQRVAGTPDQVPQHAVYGPDGSLYVTFAQAEGQAMVNPSFAVRGGVWKRDGKSGKWRDISPLRTGPDAAFGYSGIDIGPDGTLAVSTLDRWWPGDDIFISRDGGAKWSGLGQQSRHDASKYPWMADSLKGEDRMGHWMSDVRINPFDADELTYGTGGGVWTSRNLTAAGSGQPVMFEFNVENLEEGAVIQMASPTGGATLLAAFGDIGGGAWDDITKTPNTGLFHPTTETNFSIDYAGLRPGVLARTVNTSGTRGFYSEDGGGSWTLFPSSPYKPPGKGEAWRGPGQIAVSAKGGFLLWVPEKEGAQVSTDKGRTWKPSANWPANRDQPIRPLADKTVEGVFYVHDRAGGSILCSVDGGASFKPIASGLPVVQGWEQAQLAIPSSRMRDLWLALPSGLIHSRDAQSPFAQIKGVDAAWAVGFGAPAVKDGYPTVFLYGRVKGQEGLWRSDDEARTWVRINDDAHQFGTMHTITGDPLEYGIVYIAPHGRGVIVGRP
jgi:hypothetical protein